MVCAYPDENGNVARRSLILSITQLVKLAQQQTQQLIFENGEVAVVLELTNLLSGDVQQLM